MFKGLDLLRSPLDGCTFVLVEASSSVQEVLLSYFFVVSSDAWNLLKFHNSPCGTRVTYRWKKIRNLQFPVSPEYPIWHSLDISCVQQGILCFPHSTAAKFSYGNFRVVLAYKANVPISIQVHASFSWLYFCRPLHDVIIVYITTK